MTDTTSSVRMTAATRLYLYVSLSLVAMLVLLPLVTTALGGFKSLGDLRVNPFGLLPMAVVELSRYPFRRPLLAARMLNSLFIAAITVALTVIVSAMAPSPSPMSGSSVEPFAELLPDRAHVSGNGDPAALHPHPRSRPARHLLGA